MKPQLILAAGALLAGCTLGPNYQQPDLSAELPTQVHSNGTAHSTALTEQWWTAFNDPAMNQLVSVALQRNLDLAGANAAILQARAQLNIADSASQAQVNADGRVGRDQFSKNSENFANIPFPHPLTGFTDYRGGFDASWEIDLFGHNRRAVEAAQARLNSIEYQRADVALRVAAEVARNVIDYRAAMQRSDNARQLLADSEHALALVKLQQQAGLLSLTDVADAQSAMHNAAAGVPPFQSAASGALMALTVLVHQNEQQVSTALRLGSAIPQAPAVLDAPGLPSDLLLRRPDLRSAERELAAATADIGVAVADQYPRFNLLASGGLDSITPGKFTNLASRYWNVGPQLTLPILSGGRLAAQVSAREAARDASLAQYRQAVLAAFADAEAALIRCQREQQRLAQIRLSYQSQQQQLQFATQRYQTGDTNYTAVLQAHSQLAQLNDLQLASEQTLADDLTALYKALGGSAVIDAGEHAAALATPSPPVAQP